MARPWERPADIYVAPLLLPDSLCAIEADLDQFDSHLQHARLSHRYEGTVLLMDVERHPSFHIAVDVDEYGTAHVGLTRGDLRSVLQMRAPCSLLAKPMAWKSTTAEKIRATLNGLSAIGIAKATSGLIRTHLRHASDSERAEPDFRPALDLACEKADAIAHTHDYWDRDTGEEIFVDLPTPWSDARYETDEGTRLKTVRNLRTILPTVLGIHHECTDADGKSGDRRSIAIRAVMGVVVVPDPLDRLRAETRNPQVVAIRRLGEPSLECRPTRCPERDTAWSDEGVTGRVKGVGTQVQ